MKGLEYFERFKIEYKKYCPYLIKSDYIMLDTIEKELKALEIIKKKRVDTRVIKFIKSVRKYNQFVLPEKPNKKDLESKLTKQEYDLLKEVLKNE